MGVSEILERMIGPFLFVLAIGSFYLLLGHQESFLRDAKSVYLEDEVYSQASVTMEDQESVSRSELIGILIAHPSVSARIEIPAEFVCISVDTTGSATMEVTVTQTDSGAKLFHKIMTNMEGFPKNYVVFGDYDVSYEYANGDLKCVVYTQLGE